jgi:uncharacterized protein YggE
MLKFLLFLPALLLADTKVSSIETASILLQPDKLSISLSFEEQSKNSDEIKTHFNLLTKSLKSADKNHSCSGGGYYVSPIYRYDKNIQYFNNYSGSLSFNCQVSSIQEFNIIDAATSLVRDSNVKVNQGSLTWIISDEAKRNSQIVLEKNLFKQILTKNTQLSQYLNKKCDISSVELNHVNNSTPRPMMMMAKSVDTESPIKQDLDNSLSANIEFLCK